MPVLTNADLGRKHFGHTFTANGASNVVVPFTQARAGMIVKFGLLTVGGTVGAVPAVKLITPGVSFTVAATASDTSVYTFSVE